MATQVQYRRGSAAQNNSFVGALAEITVDTTNGTLRVHDGIAAGGSNIATVAYVDNSISSLSANSITDGTSSVAIIATNGNIRANVGGSTVQLLSSDGATITGFVSATGNVSGGNVSTAGNIDCGNLTATGNVTAANIDSVNADVAERYLADAVYAPGTVLEIGGAAEVRATQTSHSTRTVGVVSTAPALIMNSGMQSDHAVTVALLGRAPCRVMGTIQRGDLLVSSDQPGVAMALTAGQYQPGSVIGKALNDKDTPGLSVIEVLVGRL